MRPLGETARRIKPTSKSPEREGQGGISKRRMSHSDGRAATEGTAYSRTIQDVSRRRSNPLLGKRIDIVVIDAGRGSI